MASEPGSNTVNYEIWCEQLRAKNEQLEQQLAQAREEIAWLQQSKAQTQRDGDRTLEAFRQQREALAQAREALDQSEGTVASLRLDLWETLHKLEEARALLVRPSELLENMCGLIDTPPSFKADAERWLEQYHTFLADKEPSDG